MHAQVPTSATPYVASSTRVFVCVPVYYHARMLVLRARTHPRALSRTKRVQVLKPDVFMTLADDSPRVPGPVDIRAGEDGR
jgi:hypothetical protein